MNPEACCYSSLQRTVRNYSHPSFAIRILSKQLPSFFCHKEGFFRKPTSPPLPLMNSFLKSPRPSLPLKRAPPLSPSPFPLRGQGMCQPPYSVLKPLRYKVGGPSEVSPAAELHFAVCDRMDTNCLGAAKAQKPIAARPEAQKPTAARPEVHNSTP